MQVLAPGQRFGAYQIEAVAGRGATGVVYVAEQVRLGRKVALKVLSGEYAHDEALAQRFLRESRTAAALDHPHIVPIFDAGEEAGTPYLAMKLIPGGDLKEMLAQRPGGLAPQHVLAVAQQIGSALDTGALRGLIHRDVKPANILLEDRGGEWHCYLVDYGIAKHSAAATLTKANQFVGTLLYIAPEQIEGKATTGATDQYSLGCVLYEALTGQPPFAAAGDNPVTLLHAHLSQAPPRVTAVRPALPPALDSVIQRALAKNPLERYASCGDLARALGAGVAGGPDAWGTGPRDKVGAPTAQPPPGGTALLPGGAAAAPPPRRRRGLLVTVIVAIVLLGVAGTLLALANRDDEPEVAGATEAAGTEAGGTEEGATEAGATEPSATDPAATEAPTGDPQATALATPEASEATAPTTPLAVTAGDSEGGVTPTAIAVVVAGDDPVAWTPADAINRQPTWAPDGGIVFASNRGGSEFGLWRLGAAAAQPGQLTSGATDLDPAVSPDGASVAFARLEDGTTDLWVLDIASGELQQVTSGPATDLRPAWSPDGSAIAFMSDQLTGDPTEHDIHLVAFEPGAAPVTDAPRVAGTDGADDFHPDWTPDGDAIVYTSDALGTRDILLQPLDGGPPQPLVADPQDSERNADISPDGLWVAYQLDHDDAPSDVWVVTVDGRNAQPVITEAGDPAW